MYMLLRNAVILYHEETIKYIFHISQRHFAVYSMPAPQDESLKTIVNGILEVRNLVTTVLEFFLR